MAEISLAWNTPDLSGWFDGRIVTESFPTPAASGCSFFENSFDFCSGLDHFSNCVNYLVALSDDQSRSFELLAESTYITKEIVWKHIMKVESVIFVRSHFTSRTAFLFHERPSFELMA